MKTASALNNSGIYIIRSLLDARCYVGSGANLRMRFNGHRRSLRKGIHENPKLQNFYNKYGEVSLEWSVLEFCEKDQLIVREQFYLDTIKPWFNVHTVAKSPIGRVVSQETRKKLSIINTGRIFTPEHRAAIGRALKGRKSVNKGKPMSEEQKKKLSDARRGMKLSKEHREKISKGLMGRPSPTKGTKFSEERRAKCKTFLGKKHTEETKRKMSLAQRGKVFSEAQRTALSMAHRGRGKKLNEAQVREIKNRLYVKDNQTIYIRLRKSTLSRIPLST